MAKKVSKAEAIKTISEIEPLEIILERIGRNETVPSKNAKLNRLINEISKQIKEERDITICSVKAK